MAQRRNTSPSKGVNIDVPKKVILGSPVRIVIGRNDTPFICPTCHRKQRTSLLMRHDEILYCSRGCIPGN
jgi:hypothetical protein